MDNFHDFYINLAQVLEFCVLADAPNDIMSGIHKRCVEGMSIVKNPNVHIGDFFETIGMGRGDFAGVATMDQFYTMTDGDSVNVRRFCNMFWAYVKCIFTGIFCEDTTLDLLIDKIFVDKTDAFIQNKKQMVNMILSNQLGQRDMNIMLTTPKRNVYAELFRLSNSIPRSEILSIRDLTVSGYNKTYMESVSDSILPLLDSSEVLDGHEHECYPWTGKSIYGVKDSSSYATWCSINKIYYVSGMSGTTFEVVIWLILFLDDITVEVFESIIKIMLHFHVLRGTHSVLEVIMSLMHINIFFEQCGITRVCAIDEVMFRVSDDLVTVTISKSNMVRQLLGIPYDEVYDIVRIIA
jgi:hypothetical protein